MIEPDTEATPENRSHDLPLMIGETVYGRVDADRFDRLLAAEH